MLKSLFSLLVLLYSFTTFSQATLFADNFEFAFTWTATGDLAPNFWLNDACAGNGTSFPGSNSLYISQGGSIPGCGATGTEQYTYTNAPAASTNEAIIYNNVDATCASALQVAFDYRVDGIAAQDYAELVYSTDGGTSWLPVGGELSISAVWTSTIIALPALLDGIAFELGFRFTYDDATTGALPIALDNVIVTGTDVIDPVIICPVSINQPVDGTCLAVCDDYTDLSFMRSDNCTDSIYLVITQDIPEFTIFASGPGGFETITLTVADESGNSTQCAITLNIIDTLAPTPVCPADTNVYVDLNCDGLVPDFTGGIPATDNCTTLGNLVFAQTPPPLTVINGISLTPMTLTVTDEDGNSTVCNFNMQTIDTLLTQITCPPDTNLIVGAACNFILGDYTSGAILVDNCSASPLVVTQSPLPGTLITANQIITLSVTGGIPALPSTCVFNGVLIDTISPTILCPPGAQQYVDASCTVALPDFTGGSIVIENCSFGATVTQSPLPTTLVGVNPAEVITLTVTDAGGNTGTCQFSIPIFDTLAPTVTCPSNQLEPADALCLATIGDYTSLALPLDNCSAVGAITVSQSPLPGLTIGGTQAVTITVVDESSNSATCTFDVNIIDLIAPGITCPGPQTVGTTIGCDYTLGSFTGLATGTDNCSPVGGLIFAQSPTAGTILPLGIHSITIIVQDTSGNTAFCNFDLTVEDQTGPTFTTCPSTQLAPVDAACQASLADYTSLAVVNDNCSSVGNISLVQSPPSGTTISSPIIVTITATDEAGNTTDCLVSVIPDDTTSPVVICPADQLMNIDASCQYLVPDLTGLVAGTDNCSVLAAMTITQNPLPATTAGGITPVLITLVDENGNQSTCIMSLLPDDITPPTITCPSPAPVNIGILCDYVLPNYGTLAIITDNCTSYTVTQTPPVTSTVNPGMNLITLDVIDSGGNSASCSFYQTVIENESPVIACPNDTVSCDPVMFYTLPTFADNCFAYLEQIDVTGYTVGSTFPVGVTVIEYAAIDSSGNSQTCQFRVEILDYPSAAIIPADTILLCDVNTTVLNADPATSGTGLWTLLSGQGIINNASSNSTGVNNLGYGTNIFEWSISSVQCGSYFDTIYVINSQAPLPTNITEDSIFACADIDINLTASPPLYGTGVWTVNSSAIIDDVLANVTAATLSDNGWQLFTWTVSNGSCPAVSDSVFVLYTPLPNASVSDSAVCIENSNIVLSADSILTGQSVWWHFTTGDGLIVNPTNNITGATNLENG
ncbi:MAG: hypothetical protein ACI837_000833, partial [Crocinitomicaceae bacterium]